MAVRRGGRKHGKDKLKVIKRMPPKNARAKRVPWLRWLLYVVALLLVVSAMVAMGRLVTLWWQQNSSSWQPDQSLVVYVDSSLSVVGSDAGRGDGEQRPQLIWQYRAPKAGPDCMSAIYDGDSGYYCEQAWLAGPDLGAVYKQLGRLTEKKSSVAGDSGEIGLRR